MNVDYYLKILNRTQNRCETLSFFMRHYEVLHKHHPEKRMHIVLQILGLYETFVITNF